MKSGYWERRAVLDDGTERAVLETYRGGRESWDETTYLTVPCDAVHRGDRQRIVAKSEVVRFRRVFVRVK